MGWRLAPDLFALACMEAFNKGWTVRLATVPPLPRAWFPPQAQFTHQGVLLGLCRHLTIKSTQSWDSRPFNLWSSHFSNQTVITMQSPYSRDPPPCPVLPLLTSACLSRCLYACLPPLLSPISKALPSPLHTSHRPPRLSSLLKEDSTDHPNPQYFLPGPFTCSCVYFFVPLVIFFNKLISSDKPISRIPYKSLTQSISHTTQPLSQIMAMPRQPKKH